MRPRRHSHHRKYYVVSFIFNDEGKKQTRLLRVPKGCKFLRNVRHSYEDTPDNLNGHHVIGWVNVYSADDQCADEFSPIIRLKKDPILYEILRWILKGILLIAFFLLLFWRDYG